MIARDPSGLASLKDDVKSYSNPEFDVILERGEGSGADNSRARTPALPHQIYFFGFSSSREGGGGERGASLAAGGGCGARGAAA